MFALKQKTESMHLKRDFEAPICLQISYCASVQQHVNVCLSVHQEVQVPRFKGEQINFAAHNLG